MSGKVNNKTATLTPGTAPLSAGVERLRSITAGPVKKVSTLPSEEVYIVDVPEVTTLTAAFEYHYFVPDEGVSETGDVPKRFLNRPGASFDAQTVNLMTSRVPRMVRLTFTPPVPASKTLGPVTEAEQKEAAARVGQTGTLISSNITKIVSEDAFTSGRYLSVLFQDGASDDKMYDLISGSYAQVALEQHDDTSHYRAGGRLSDALPHVDRGFIMSNITRAAQAHGTRFFPHGVNGPEVIGNKSQDPAVTIGLQINSKFVHDIIERAVVDPHGHFSSDMHPIRGTAKQVQRQARLRSNPSVVEDDYKSFPRYAFVKATEANHMPTPCPAQIVGYIVDRKETMPDGSTKERDPIVIENPVVGQTIDLCVRYGASYTYTVRTIARFTFSAIDDDTGAIVTVTALVSSRPSNRAWVKCFETVAPPPPADVGFTWDHDAEKMAVHWTFPPNPQRDIKRFQVFRRQSILEPFELIKVYDFDDSQVPIPQLEHPDAARVEHLTSPKSWFIDDEFTKTSKNVYALGCVDAHGNVSAYSAQFLVWFDQFRNRLMTHVVSHFGAPRQYPNMYLEADTFVDTIRDSGHSRLNLYFTPECYHVFDDNERIVPVITTDRDGGSYRLQCINPDAQKMGTVDVTLLERRVVSAPG